MAFVAKRKKLLTRPVLKLVIDEPRFVKMTSKMFIGKELKKQKEDAKKKEPATLIEVIDLETGEEAQIIANAVLKSVLDEFYPQDAYVGKSFQLTKHSKQEGKDYFPVAVEEIEEPKPGEITAAKKAAAEKEKAAAEKAAAGK